MAEEEATCRVHIQARLAELTAQHERARLQYAEMEEHIKGLMQNLALLQRNIDAMHGGMQELEALCAGSS